MELKVWIVSIACFSCLIPSVFSTGILEAKLAAVGAAKGAALLGAKALVKKGAVALAAKGAAAIAAKGLLLKGFLTKKGPGLIAAKEKALNNAIQFKGSLLKDAVTLGAKVVKTGAEILADKLPVIQPTVVVQRPVVIPPPPVLPDFVIDCKPEFKFPLPQPPPPISIVTVDIKETTTPKAEDNVEVVSDPIARVWHKLQAAGILKRKLFRGVVSPIRESPLVGAPVIYDIIETPRIYSTPYIEVSEDIK